VVLALVLRPNLRFEYKGVLLCVAAIVFNRIYSAQFNLWFYPFLLLGLAEEKTPRLARILGLAVALDLLNVVVFPLSFTLAFAEMGGFSPYAAVLGGGPWTMVFSVAIVARAVLLVVLAALLLIAPDPDGMMPRS
jgi:hypothetical protein